MSRDALGLPNAHRHWVLVGYDSAEDIYLTPTAARQLAAQLLDAADTITATTEGTTA